MRILYFDFGMGAAGDMLSAALFELLDDKEKENFLNEINKAGIPGVKVEAGKAVKCGITGTHIKVTVEGQEEHSHDYHEEDIHEHEHEHEHHHEEHVHEHEGHHHDHTHHHHAGMEQIENIISSLNLSAQVKSNAIEIYKLIAQAESKAHNLPVTDIHFHEVGTMDAIADICSVCLLFEKLEVAKIYASPVHVGSGQVHCAHGILPVPAPATASLLEGIPVYGGSIKGELCTPTGAAILKFFVSHFGQMPYLTIQKSGYGMGKKDFEAANCVRVFLGEEEEKPEQIVEFTCNLDDISAEGIGFAMEELFNAGALEVYTIPVTMKKSRPGNLLCVMCRESEKEKIMKTIFQHTTTLGIRENISTRYALDRHIEKLQTPYGEVRVKCSQGYGVTRKKIEYEDLARIARQSGKSLEQLRDELKTKS